MKKQIKDEVGELIVDEILTFVGGGNSPVSGRGKFKTLNKDYAEAEKGGDRKPNLELDGDMLDSLTYKRTSDGIEVGIFQGNQVGKADGHNNFSGDSRLPERRFIPDEDETFKAQIVSRVKELIKINTPADTTVDDPTDVSRLLAMLDNAPVTTEINLDALIGDVFADLFGTGNG